MSLSLNTKKEVSKASPSPLPFCYNPKTQVQHYSTLHKVTSQTECSSYTLYTQNKPFHKERKQGIRNHQKLFVKWWKKPSPTTPKSYQKTLLTFTPFNPIKTILKTTKNTPTNKHEKKPTTYNYNKTITRTQYKYFTIIYQKLL